MTTRRLRRVRFPATLVAGIVFVTANTSPIVCAVRHHGAAPAPHAAVSHHDHGMSAPSPHAGSAIREAPAGGRACTDVTACCHSATGLVTPLVGVQAAPLSSVVVNVTPLLFLLDAGIAPATPPPRA